MTNIIGTVNLLNASRKIWEEDFKNKMFYHVSTDEAYGSLGETGFFMKLLRTIHNLHIHLQKQVQIILLEHMVIHMVFRILFLIVLITMALINLKSYFLIY